MNRKSFACLFISIIIVFTLLGSFLLKKDNTSARRTESHDGDKRVQIKIVNGDSSLNGAIEFSLEEFEPPLHLKVSSKNSILLNAGDPQPPWVQTFLLSWNPTQLAFETYRSISTHDALLYCERETKEKFDSAMVLASPPSNWAGLKATIVWTYQISCSAGDFVFVVMSGGSHLSSIKEIADPRQLTLSIFRLFNGNFLIESPEVIEKIGLDRIDHKSLDTLRSIANAKVIDMTSSPVRIIQ